MATNSLDSRTQEQLVGEGVNLRRLKERKVAARDQPYTTAGLPFLQVMDTPELKDTPFCGSGHH